jgi:hypothetical protein
LAKLRRRHPFAPREENAEPLGIGKANEIGNRADGQIGLSEESLGAVQSKVIDLFENRLAGCGGEATVERATRDREFFGDLLDRNRAMAFGVDDFERLIDQRIGRRRRRRLRLRLRAQDARHRFDRFSEQSKHLQ